MSCLPGFATAGPQALRWWRLLTDLGPRTGLWPLIVNGSTAERLEVSGDYDPLRWIAAADTLDGAQLLADWGRNRLDIYGPELAGTVRDELAGLGTWPEQPQRRAYADILTSPSGKPYDVYLVLVTARANWQIPCVLGIRGWNEYPNPDQHAAILRYWHGRYGAELVTAFDDAADIAVARPPRDRHQALQLAWEYQCYNDGAYDIYGADCLTDLAASLVDADCWRAWWD